MTCHHSFLHFIGIKPKLGAVSYTFGPVIQEYSSKPYKMRHCIIVC